MTFKEFFIKNIMTGFFISVTFICLGIAAVGSIFEPAERIPYNGFVSPIIFGLAATLPTLIMYSKRELSVKELIFRKLLHLLLLEITINGMLFITGALKTVSVAVSLVLTILIIDLAVNAVMYLSDLRNAERINRSIKEMQSKNK